MTDKDLTTLRAQIGELVGMTAEQVADFPAALFNGEAIRRLVAVASVSDMARRNLDARLKVLNRALAEAPAWDGAGRRTFKAQIVELRRVKREFPKPPKGKVTRCKP